MSRDPETEKNLDSMEIILLQYLYTTAIDAECPVPLRIEAAIGFLEAKLRSDAQVHTEELFQASELLRTRAMDQ